jgi:hypothetical protein
MGNVQYPIEAASIPNLPTALKFIANNPFVITFPLGALGFASSRESLSYDEITNAKLIEHLEEVRVALADSFKTKVYSGIKNHIDFFNSFAATYSEFKKVVNVGASFSHRYGYNDTREDEINNSYLALLVGKDVDGHLDFQGQSFLIKDLINRVWTYTVPKHQCFGMMRGTTRGRHSSRFAIARQTKMKFDLNVEIDANEIYDRGSNYKLEVGKTIYHDDWRSKYISPRAENLSFLDKLFEIIDKFDVSSRNHFIIEANKKVCFVVNDVGSSGIARFKELHERRAIAGTQLIFIDFHPKVTTLTEVMLDLQYISKTKLTGSTISLLSDLPDPALLDSAMF